MAVNKKNDYTQKILGLAVLCVLFFLNAPAQAQPPLAIQACVRISDCLGWKDRGRCGYYQDKTIKKRLNPHELRLSADSIQLQAQGLLKLQGKVQLKQGSRVVNATTAYVWRKGKTIVAIQLQQGIRYQEPGVLLFADQATLHPQDKSGEMTQVLYRLDTHRQGAQLPAWGQAGLVKHFANQDFLLQDVSYTTCPPQHSGWQIKAKRIYLNHQTQTGTAEDAVLLLNQWPLLYTPYMTFPTSKQRKSGFLLPTYGYSNVNDFDVALPYYWNIAPNYDATLVPHAYTKRGLMLGGEFRYLNPQGTGIVGGNVLPKDSAFNQFLIQNQDQYTALQGLSNNRWSLLWHDDHELLERLTFHVNYQQVSDDYYLQDFSNNLAVITENQLPREASLTYSTDHWIFSSLLQSYQTLNPINQSAISNIYERLPQLIAQGHYDQLPLNTALDVDAQFDYFRWPVYNINQPQGPRSHINPKLTFNQQQSWGYIKPTVELIDNYYDLHYQNGLTGQTYNITLGRYSVEGGLVFEKPWYGFKKPYTQTLEPRLYYLYVPYQDQSAFPAFDSAYMIFNTDQLFRDNRFSGFDRISDANQLAYAITTRLLSDKNGLEKANLTVGQIRYFSKRQVQLCYNISGVCNDNPLTLGYISNTELYSPIAARAVYFLNPAWNISADYAWDPATHATNNGYVNLHYQPQTNEVITFGYTYLVNGNLLDINNNIIQTGALNQATIAFGWPLNEQWSALGIYNYNISKGYDMLAMGGLQYDSCCWAIRIVGGRSFQSLTPDSAIPQYNNNVAIQILLKGLGSFASNDPSSTIRAYIPGYEGVFR